MTRRTSTLPPAACAGRAGGRQPFSPRLVVLSCPSASMARNRSRLLAREPPRPRRPSNWLITHAPTLYVARSARRTIPLPSLRKELPSHVLVMALSLQTEKWHFCDLPRLFCV